MTVLKAGIEILEVVLNFKFSFIFTAPNHYNSFLRVLYIKVKIVQQSNKKRKKTII